MQARAFAHRALLWVSGVRLCKSDITDWGSWVSMREVRRILARVVKKQLFQAFVTFHIQNEEAAAILSFTFLRPALTELRMKLSQSPKSDASFL